MIDDHDIPRDPHLVAVGSGIGERDGRHAARLARIRDIEDGGAELRTIGDMAHIGVTALHGDLAGSSQIEMANPANIAGERASIIGCAVQCHILSMMNYGVTQLPVHVPLSPPHATPSKFVHAISLSHCHMQKELLH